MRQPARILLFLVIAILLPIATPAAAQDAGQYDGIIDQIEDVRDLDLLDEIDIQFVSQDDYAEQFAGEFFSDDEVDAFADEQRVLVAFGLLSEEDDLAEIYASLYSGGIAGFYDPYSNQMVVITKGDGDGELTAINEVTFAHEMVHALQDQHFDLMALSQARSVATNDASLAITALIEGDASLAETDYLLEDMHLAVDYLTEIREPREGPNLWETTPAIILAPLSFPYSEGQVFVSYLQEQGGWDLVNATYEQPPATTEQVLHPEKYVDGEVAIEVDVPDFSGTLGSDWRVIEQDTWGEFSISVILADAGLSEEALAEAHTGWGGDSYVAVTNEEDTAAAWVTEWDTEKDAEEFLRALVARESGRLDAEVQRDGNVITLATDDVVIQIVQDGTRVTWLQGPDTETVSDIWSAIAG